MPTNDNDIPAKLDELIVQVEDDLIGGDAVSDDFDTTLGQFERLVKIRKIMTPEPIPAPEPVIDKDRIRLKDFIPVIASIGGILIIVTFEAFGHTIGTKATAFVSKSK